MSPSPISDGYGDDLTIPEVVARFQRWAHAVAGVTTSPYSPDYDDLVQEALIEIWRQLEIKGGKQNVSASYLTTAGKHRIQDIAWHGRAHFGTADGSHHYRPTTTSIEPLLSPETSEPFDSIASLFSACDDLAAVELAYHHGEIMSALSTLSPAHREYVNLRFWHGLNDPEIATRLGLSSHKIPNTWWRRTIRPALQTHLAHLIDA